MGPLDGQERTALASLKRPIKPQVRYHNMNADGADAYNNNDNTPFIRKQLLLSEDDNNIFQAARINPTEAPNGRALQRVQREQNQPTSNRVKELIMMETPSRIRNLVNRITPTVSKIFSRPYLNNQIADQYSPSSPLLSIPTVRANRQRPDDMQFEFNEFDEYPLEAESPTTANNFLNLTIKLLLFLPRLFWNNLQMIWKIAYFVLLLPFIKLFQVFTQQPNPRELEEDHVEYVNIYFNLGNSLSKETPHSNISARFIDSIGKLFGKQHKYFIDWNIGSFCIYNRYF